ncbi:MAG: aminoacyl-tRNA hydrolase [Spirochaetales bacterium]|nr:aminoacyl-tRNA hydrolase [Spirochaetales bacterium]
MITIVALLGNIGHEYARTRHNLPWMLIDFLSFSSHLVWKEKFKGQYARHSVAGRIIYIIKPHTFMNRCGESIRAALHFFKTTPEELLVIHDDSELDFAQIDFKINGGLAGHNGLKSLVSSLGTKDFKRMRLGISHPSHGSLSSYVLGSFSPDESAILPRYLESGAEALEYCLEQGFPSALKKYQKKKLID